MFSNLLNTRTIEFQSCDTIFYQGANSTQTHVMHYSGDKVITASTGEEMRCTGRNNLKPLDVIYNLHIGPEIADVNLQPFDHFYKFFLPQTYFYCFKSWVPNYLAGVEIQPPQNTQPSVNFYQDFSSWASDCYNYYTAPSVKFHAPIYSQISYGQESDIESHRKKYLSWKQNQKNEGLILYGVSRGTAATFSAFATWKYPEVKLVILEGAIDSMENVMTNILHNLLRYDALAEAAVNGLRNAVNWLNRNGLFGHNTDGPSPLKLVNDFPKNVPVVFITSEKDTVVFPENTQNIASALHQRGSNDVYVLKLKNAWHPLYVYGNKEDHDTYETFIHAIYKKYGLAHKAELADKGADLIETCKLSRYSETDTLCVANS